MAIDPLPTDFPFLWATTGTVTVPPGGDQLSGWTFEQAPPYDWFNWLGWGSGQGLKYLKSYLDVDHDESDGHHSSPHVKTQLFLDDGLPIQWESSPGANSTRASTFSLGSPEKGGWQVTVGVLGTDFAFNSTGSPSNTDVVGATSFTATCPLNMFPFTVNDSSGDKNWTITNISINYREDGAGDAVTIAIYSSARTGTGSRTTVLAPVALAATGAGYSVATAYSGSIGIDPDLVYWVEVVCSANSANQAGVSGVDITATQKRLG